MPKIVLAFLFKFGVHGTVAEHYQHTSGMLHHSTTDLSKRSLVCWKAKIVESLALGACLYLKSVSEMMHLLHEQTVICSKIRLQPFKSISSDSYNMLKYMKQYSMIKHRVKCSR